MSLLINTPVEEKPEDQLQQLPQPEEVVPPVPTPDQQLQRAQEPAPEEPTGVGPVIAGMNPMLAVLDIPAAIRPSPQEQVQPEVAPEVAPAAPKPGETPMPARPAIPELVPPPPAPGTAPKAPKIPYSPKISDVKKGDDLTAGPGPRPTLEQQGSVAGQGTDYVIADRAALERAHSQTPEQRTATMPDAMRRAADEGFFVQMEQGDIKVSKWNGTSFEPAQSSSAVDELIALQVGAKGERTMPMPDFNEQFHQIFDDSFFNNQLRQPATQVQPPQQGPITLATTDEEINSMLPVVDTDTVGGLKIRPGIVPNLSSIEASMTNAEVLPSLREIQIAHFEDNLPPRNPDQRTRELAAEMKQTGEITPLIVAYDEQGPYILEGGHRFDAMKLNGVTSFPAVVALDVNNLRDPDVSALSTPLRRGEEQITDYGVTKPTGKQKLKVRDLAAALERRQREKYGAIDMKDRSPEALEKLADWLAEEVEYELQPGNVDGSAAGWYSTKFQKALDRLGRLFPELLGTPIPGTVPDTIKTQQDARDLMTAVLAITSDGQKVSQNFESAVRVYQEYRSTGRMPATVEGARGERSASMTKNLLRLQKLVDGMGIRGATEYLLEESTVSEMKAALKAAGETADTSLPADATMPKSALVFGPKLGAFYANLMGTEGYLTMDMWWTRTFNRMRGTLLTSPSEKGFERVGRLIQEELNLPAPPSKEQILQYAIEYASRYEAKGYKDGTELEKAANTLYKDAFVSIEEQPGGASDRGFMIATAKRAQAILAARGHKMSIADIQAIIWYYEKRLYGELGAKQSDDISYEEAAGAAVDRAQGVSQGEGAAATPRRSRRPAVPSNVGAQRGAAGARPAPAGQPGLEDVSAQLTPEATAAPDPDLMARAQAEGFDTSTVYYHGTSAAHFDRFDPYASDYGLFGMGSYFTADADIAQTYTKKGAKARERQGQEVKEGVYGVALKVKNTIDMDAAADPQWEAIGKQYDDSFTLPEGATNAQAYRAVEEALMDSEDSLPRYEGAEIMQDHLRAMGFDSITHIGGERLGKRVGEGTKHKVMIVFDPEQVAIVQRPAPVVQPVVQPAVQPAEAAPSTEGIDTRPFAERHPGLLPETPPTSEDVAEQRIQHRVTQPLELTRPVSGIPTPAQPQAPTPSKTAILDQFKKLLNLHVEQGRFGRGMSDAAAIYKWRQSVARIRNKGALIDIFHEGAHHLDAMIQTILDPVIALPMHKAELDNIGNTLYGGGGKIKVNDVVGLRREGFATWFQMWMNNPVEANRVAPLFSKAFEATLASHNPRLLAGLNALRQEVEQFLTEKPSLEAAQDRMVPLEPETTIGKISAAIKDNNVFAVLGTMSNAIYRAMISERHSITVTVRQMMKAAEGNIRRLMDQGVLDKKSASIALEKLTRRGTADPVKMFSVARNSHHASSQMIKDGIPKFGSATGDVLTKGIPEIIGMSGAISRLGVLNQEIYSRFNLYLGARRLVQEYDNYNETIKWEAAKERGLKYPEPASKRYKPPDDLSEADWRQALIELHTKHPQFEAAAQELYKFQNAFLDWRRDSAGSYGKHNEELFDYLKAMQNYVPIRRKMDTKPLGAPSTSSATKQGKDLGIKTFQGSTRQFMHPLDAIMQAVHEQTAITMHNQVKLSLVNLANDIGQNTGAIIEEIPATEMKGTMVKLSELIKASGDVSLGQEIADAMGRDEISLQEFLDEILDGDEAGTIWRSQDANEKGEKIIHVWRDGKREMWKLNDPDWAGALHETLTGLGQQQQDMMMTILSTSATTLRMGITKAPPFLAANLIRDAMGAWVLTPGIFGNLPGVAAARGIWGNMFDRKSRQVYNMSGALIGGYNVAGLDRARFESEQRRLSKMGVGVTTVGTFEAAVKLLDSGETMTRVGIYWNAFNRAKKDGLSDIDAMTEAGFTANDYADYGRSGSKTMTIRSLVIFLNANIVNLDKMFRVLGGGEAAQAVLRKKMAPMARKIFGAGRRDARGIVLPLTKHETRELRDSSLAWVKMLSLIIPSAILGMTYWDDEEYDQFTPYMKGTRWWIKIAPGKWVGIPKPFQLATFATAAEYAIDAYKGDEAAWGRFWESQAAVWGIPRENPTVKTAYEIAANKNIFTGREIITDEAMAKDPWLQYDEYTSELAKNIGAALNVSPMVIDHIITNFAGTWGRAAQSTSNYSNSNLPQRGWDDTPFISYFAKDGTRSSQVKPAFYEYIGQKSGNLIGAYNGYKGLLDEGQVGGAETYLASLDKDRQVFAVLNAWQEVDAKKLHPMRNAYDFQAIVGRMRKDIYVNRLFDKEGKGKEILLSPTQQKMLMDAMSRLQAREMRNAMVIMDDPGFGHRKILPTMTIYQEIEAIEPRVAKEMKERMKDKVYSFDKVRQLWPKVEQKLLEQGPKARLTSEVLQAKAGTGSKFFTLEGATP